MASSSNQSDNQEAVISDKLKLMYFDTGAPNGGGSYKTYLLIHGLCHNKRTWERMKEKKLNSVRLIAFTLRGYEGTTDFDGSRRLQNHEIGPILGSDFISIVNYVVDTLAVPHEKGSSLTIVAWSLAAASVIAGYGTLDPNHASPYPKWTTYISRIVFYEPAGGRGFFLKQWKPSQPAAKKSKPAEDSPAPQIDPIKAFKTAASSYYEFSEGFFSQPHHYGDPNRNDSYKGGDPLCENPKLWELCADRIFEERPMEFYARLLYTKSEQGHSGSQRTTEDEKELERETNNKFVRDALTAMAKTDVKRIHGVSTQQTLPACVLAVEWLRDFVRDVAREKFLLSWVEGHYNHYVHNIAPEKLWEALKEGEV